MSLLEFAITVYFLFVEGHNCTREQAIKFVMQEVGALAVQRGEEIDVVSFQSDLEWITEG